jgi:hyperosmotically inducible periplasmic protein
MKAMLSIVGVIAVLALGVAPVAAQEKIKEGAEIAKNAVVKGATTAADASKDGLSKTGEVMTDAWITTRVHARFVAEDLLKGSNISVETSKHVVTLTGTVTGLAGRTKAAEIAKTTEGVRRVVNRLTVGSTRNDDAV